MSPNPGCPPGARWWGGGGEDEAFSLVAMHGLPQGWLPRGEGPRLEGYSGQGCSVTLTADPAVPQCCALLVAWTHLSPRLTLAVLHVSSGEPVAPACGWCAFTATVWAACKYGSSAPISPIPCTAGSCSPFSKELKLLLLQLHAQMLLWPLAGMQEHGRFTCKQLLSLRSTKITGWTLQRVTQPARTPGESVPTTWCWPCVC